MNADPPGEQHQASPMNISPKPNIEPMLTATCVPPAGRPMHAPDDAAQHPPAVQGNAGRLLNAANRRLTKAK